MSRVAAIDCGTNSIRLLIADISNGIFKEVVRSMEVVRLGQGVDKNKSFHHFLNLVFGFANLSGEKYLLHELNIRTKHRKNRNFFIMTWLFFCSFFKIISHKHR